MIDYYDKQGEPITQAEWIRLTEDRAYKVLRQDVILGYAVSTVWLGLDHGFCPDSPPIIFETMVFAHNEDGTLDYGGVFQRRYATEAAALDGHAAALDAILDGEGFDGDDE